MGVFQRHLWAGKAEELIGVRLRLNLRCVHDLTARSPLTAAARQRSRRPDRHVVCPNGIFTPTAFLRFVNG
jgi:hypothetical protein